jgi:type IV pilus assembly protein PilA
MRSFTRAPAASRGFTLVELMIVVAIIGVLAALAIYGVSRYLGSAKTSEARNTLGGIRRSLIGAYNADRQVGVLLAEGSTGQVSAKAVCLSATAKIPANVSQVKGVKYQPALGDGQDWTAGTATAGWRCIGFTMAQPHYYQYGYTSASATEFEATAEGDLDGDGTASLFRLQGQVSGDQLKASDHIEAISNEYE